MGKSPNFSSDRQKYTFCIYIIEKIVRITQNNLEQAKYVAISVKRNDIFLLLERWICAYYTIIKSMRIMTLAELLEFIVLIIDREFEISTMQWKQTDIPHGEDAFEGNTYKG